ncbi:MAG: PDZ domain-containing protein [Rhodoferax sp.]|jgi:C-terminal processing protease CtpA/Prc
MQIRFTVALFALLLSLTSAVWAGERGYFGFGFKIDGEGVFWNPTLRSVTIEKVAPHSPAALAGMQSGDEVVEVDGKLVVGAKGKDLQGHIEKEIGESVKMKLKHTSGESVEISMVAKAKTW